MARKTVETEQQKTRSLRMDDARWEFFRRELGATWLREKIDEAKALRSTKK